VSVQSGDVAAIDQPDVSYASAIQITGDQQLPNARLAQSQSVRCIFDCNFHAHHL